MEDLNIVLELRKRDMLKLMSVAYVGSCGAFLTFGLVSNYAKRKKEEAEEKTNTNKS